MLRVDCLILLPNFSNFCRYDAEGTDLIATGSSDSTVKVWEGSSGTLKATLRGGSGNSIICCDISNGVIVGAGTDKTCRVWNLRTERMVSAIIWRLIEIIPTQCLNFLRHTYQNFEFR